MLLRRPQGRGTFAPGSPQSGYYNDLTGKASDAGEPGEGAAHVRVMTADRARANPISVAQLGLGAWQLSHIDERWLDTVEAAVAWLVSQMEPDGVISFHFAMPHTFRLRPPWPSAMAQGEIASLLARAAVDLNRPELFDRARLAVGAMLERTGPLLAQTDEGPVLQEYPTTPPAHVLNGWIFALWGLYDVAVACGDSRVQAAFDEGVDALGARISLYDTPWNWSRYDLYPHRLVHVASPFYHRLHVAQLEAMAELVPDLRLPNAATQWRAATRNPTAIAIAVARKVAFRALEPRRPLP